MKVAISSIAVFAFSVLAVLIGYSFLALIRFFKLTGFHDNTYSLCYFLGIFLILLLYRNFEFLFRNAKLAVVCSLPVFGGMIFLEGENILLKIKHFIIYENYKIVFYLLALLIIGSLYYIHYVFYHPDNISIWTSIGSAHSYRTGNIAYLIKKNNRIPILGQNYGQSMIVSIFEIIGLSHSNLVLFLFGSISMTHVFFFYYDILSELYQVSGIMLLIGTFFVVAGKENVSKKLHLCFDSGAANNWTIIGYPDTAIAICLFFFINTITLKTGLNNISDIYILLIILLSICAYVWNITSAHLIVLQIGLLFCAFVYSLLRKSNVIEIFTLFVAFTMIALIGRSVGGLFTPRKKLSAIQGALTVGKLIILRGFAIIREGVPVITRSGKNIFFSLFFPIISLIFACGIVSYGGAEKLWFLLSFSIYTFLLLIGGMIVCYPFASGDGHKHEINRFIAPAGIASRILMVLCSYQVWFMTEKLNVVFQILSKLVIMGVMIANIVILGSVFGKINSIINKILFNKNIRDELKLLFSKTQYITNDTKEAPPNLSKDNTEIYLRMQFNIKMLLDNPNSSFVLYGADKMGSITFDMLKEMERKVVCFSDGSKEKWNTKFRELTVIEPDKLKGIIENDRNIIILITSHKYIEIQKYLNKMGINNMKILTY